MAKCSERVLRIIKLERSLTRAPVSWLQRERQSAAAELELLRGADVETIASYEYRNVRPLCSRSGDWLRYKRMGNQGGIDNCFQEVADYETACAAMLSYRHKLAAAEAEDAKYRPLVTINLSEAIKAIEKKCPRIGDHLRHAISTGQTFCYDPTMRDCNPKMDAWDVRY